ncbi:hypothetical protein EXIGLDRAFT_846295 [Exidia glandulosa HHB12029]|uniref:GH16 domain-containing protein n=1 Tax=Exidia glandulosa HHB12029 TaxID=1314781 RepID=A0A165B255_EXIGL|nr:hypothetical protein EXIGLDRAFT_846295 [Exidia glandulosa HHB12029]
MYEDETRAAPETGPGSVSIRFFGFSAIPVCFAKGCTAVPFNDKRFSVSINTTETYGPGNVFVLDAIHIPFGCSVWPAYWTAARVWPTGGEIDIMEQTNRATNNQMALHTKTGCTLQQDGAGATGTVLSTDCASPDNSGCIVRDPSTASYGAGFNSAGGGMWVTEFATTGISIWFYSRPDIPATLQSSANSTSIDTATLGAPVAHYPSTSCDIPTFFQEQAIVLDISLCGVFGRAVFNDTCPATKDNACYLDWVIGPAANYTEAYFEIVSLRIFNDGSANSFSGPVTAPDASTGGSSGNGGSGGDTSGDNGLGGGNGTGAAPQYVRASVVGAFGAVLLGAAALWAL